MAKTWDSGCETEEISVYKVNHGMYDGSVVVCDTHGWQSDHFPPGTDRDVVDAAVRGHVGVEAVEIIVHGYANGKMIWEPAEGSEL